jgi:hypothetical protein
LRGDGHGERLGEQPGSWEPRGDGSGKQKDPGGAEKRELEARVLDQLRIESEHERRRERQHRYGIGPSRAGRREHRRARHQCASDGCRPGSADEHVRRNHRQRDQQSSPSRPLEASPHCADQADDQHDLETGNHHHVDQPGILKRRAHVGGQRFVDAEGDAQDQRCSRLGEGAVDCCEKLLLSPGDRASRRRTTGGEHEDLR